VLSGHPLNTTLFNTIRNLWYHEYYLLREGIVACHFAAGDDCLTYYKSAPDVDKYRKYFPDGGYGKQGLGIVMKDLKIGALHEMDFLSKNLVTDGFNFECYRKESKVANSGKCTESLKPGFLPSEYKFLQFLNLLDLPDALGRYTKRFKDCIRDLTPRIRNAFKYDWSFRMYADVSRKELSNFYYSLNPAKIPLDPISDLDRELHSEAMKELRGGYYPLATNKAHRYKMPRKNNKRTKKTPIGNALVRVINAKYPNNRPKRNKPRAKRSSGNGYIVDRHPQYTATLSDPWTKRGIRIPSPLPAPTQLKCIHGNISFTTNALGYARIAVKLLDASILVYNDVTHTESVIGAASTLLAADADLSASIIRRLVSGGIKVRSVASFSNESGLIQSYSSIADNPQFYDVYRDSPHQRVYSKGEVAIVRYIPFDISETLLGNYDVLTRHYIGVMVKGAISATYDLQYSMNYEFVSANNTDLVPHVIGPTGKPEETVQKFAGVNHADDNHFRAIEQIRQYNDQKIDQQINNLMASGDRNGKGTQILNTIENAMSFLNNATSRTQNGIGVGNMQLFSGGKSF